MGRVIGTLQEPCDAYAVEAALKAVSRLQVEEELIVIAIDACLGKPQSVGVLLQSGVHCNLVKQLAEGCLLSVIIVLPVL